MLLRKYWIPLSVFIVAIVGVSLYVLQTRPPKDPILIVKPVEFEKQPAKTPVVEQPAEVGHVHEDGTFHADTPAPVATPTRTGELTYHADLLASHPVEALRAQAKERGHWSARWIPPFPSDDHEAAALARSFYHIVYYRSTSEAGTPKSEQVWIENRRLMDTVMEYSPPRSSDLLKLSWAILQSGDISDPYYAPSNFPLSGMTYISSLGIYQYIPAEYVHLFKE